MGGEEHTDKNRGTDSAMKVGRLREKRVAELRQEFGKYERRRPADRVDEGTLLGILILHKGEKEDKIGALFKRLCGQNRQKTLSISIESV
jgi:hypothetical protein